MQNENIKMKNDLSERLLEFAADIIKLTDKISKSYTGRHIQLSS